MAAFDNVIPPQKNGFPKNGARAVTYSLGSDKKGLFYHDPQDGRVEVVALYCDCGRSILVNTRRAKDTPVICSLCNSTFSWQQLTFSD